MCQRSGMLYSYVSNHAGGLALLAVSCLLLLSIRKWLHEKAGLPPNKRDAQDFLTFSSDCFSFFEGESPRNEMCAPKDSDSDKSGTWRRLYLRPISWPDGPDGDEAGAAGLQWWGVTITKSVSLIAAIIYSSEEDNVCNYSKLLIRITIVSYFVIIYH